MSGERVQAERTPGRLAKQMIYNTKSIYRMVTMVREFPPLGRGSKVTVLDLSNDDYFRTGGEDIMSSSVMGI